MVQSVRLSVRPFVRRTFLTMFPSSHHHEILELITIVKSDVKCKPKNVNLVSTETFIRSVAAIKSLRFVLLHILGTSSISFLSRKCVLRYRLQNVAILFRPIVSLFKKYVVLVGTT